MEKVTTFVNNIPFRAQAGELVRFLEGRVGQGTIFSAEIQFDKKSFRSLGKATVQFEDQEAAHKLAELSKSGQLYFESRLLKVNVHNKDIVHKPKHNLISLEECTLDMGWLTQEDTMQVLWSSQPQVTTEFDFNNKRVRHAFVLESTTGILEYKLEFHFNDLVSIGGANLPRDGFFAFLLELQNPPRVFFRKVPDSSNSDRLSEILEGLWFFCKGAKEESWVRTTDFTSTSSIGKSLAYLLRCPNSVIRKTKNDILSKLAGFRLASYPSTPRRLVLETTGVSNVTCQTLVPIVDAPPGANIGFDVMFLLNVLVQLGLIIPANLTRAFYSLLHRIPAEYLKLALREIGSSNRICYDPADWITRFVQKVRKSQRMQVSNGGSIKLEAGLLNVHRLYITPTKVYCLGPEIDMSNRVTRRHIDKIDNFLRVSFVEEDWDSMSASALSSGVGKERSPVYDRILSVMREGVELAGKKYEFLAFSSSQLREQSFWMFASDDGITANVIRAWMGDFLNIRNVALCAARMGQCFSTSTPTLEVPRDEVEYIPDVERVDPETGIKYNFSDGIGKISKELAQKVARKCGFKRMGVGITPSAFQIRYGGFKGVVAVDPYSLEKLSLRPSMNKFPSTHIGLELLNWSKFLPCYLNRQVISLLSTLRVPDLVFERMQASVLTQLDAMLVEPAAALEILQVTSAGQTHEVATQMLEAGYLPNREPYLKSIMDAFRAYQLLNLRTRTRIFVPKGACLMGCLDESAYLNYGEVFLQLTPTPGNRRHFNDGLSGFQRYYHGAQKNMVARVVKGAVVVAKNPCVHPGDVRVLQAVDIPSLHHMVNCLVFPQEGHRPHPNECSGSDLDGDLYFVSWDESLVPHITEKPMDYTPAPKVLLDHSVTVEDLQEFFVNYMVNDNLGQIANAHVVFCDIEALKARSPRCIELARLFSVAVDFPKTGVPAIIPSNLRPREYPDFMEKVDKPTYKSESVIGKLFRSVKEAAKEPFLSVELTRQSMMQNYDRQLQVSGYEEFLAEADYYRHTYDSKLICLMNQYGIETEAEVMSGNILRLSRHFRKHAGEATQRIRLAVKALIREAREWFFDGIYSDSDEEDYDSWRNDKYAKASAWYHVTYHPDYLHQDDQFSSVSRSRVHLLSFPWAVSDFLFRIKKSSSMSAE